MPSAVEAPAGRNGNGIIKFTNCRLVKADKLAKEDLWISSITGKILSGQTVFYEEKAAPEHVIDLGGRILAPGLIDVQLNGAFGFDFSQEPDSGITYAKDLMKMNQSLIKTGVTSYLPTVTSARREVYHKVIPYLGPSGARRTASDGAESLGVHVEGPFLNPSRNGIHDPAVLRTPSNGFADLEDCYGQSNLESGGLSPIRLITLAPELPGGLAVIPYLRSCGVIVSIGHSDATYEEAKTAVSGGAVMITHLFNAMRGPHHRNPGIFGLLGTATDPSKKPFFGVISDGIHLHPTTVRIAFSAHPEGLILVTDSMSVVGLPDGIYDWTNGAKIQKQGTLVTLVGTDGKIAGASITLVECVSNFVNWTGASISEAIRAVTATPARMLGLEGVKGSLEPGADADLVVLDDITDDFASMALKVRQVWKFGELVHEE